MISGRCVWTKSLISLIVRSPSCDIVMCVACVSVVLDEHVHEDMQDQESFCQLGTAGIYAMEHTLSTIISAHAWNTSRHPRQFFWKYIMCDIASGEGAAFCNEQVSMKRIDLLLRKQV
jgi:hypothetical protein